MEKGTKTILMPGWLQKTETYKGFDVFDIWGKDLDLKYDEDADYIIGHSVGANFALYIWNNNKNKKLILVNPLFPRRNLISWLWRWLNDLGFEDISRVNYLSFKSIKSLLFLLRFDPMPILLKIPKNDIAILRGKKDYHICNNESLLFIKEAGLSATEIDAKHEWSDDYSNEVKRVLDSWKME